MEKLYINVPEGDVIIENKELRNALFFLELHNRAAEEESTLRDIFKTEFMSLLLLKNKLFHVVEDVVDTAVQLAVDYDTDTEQVDIEAVLEELVDEGYFVELTD